MAAEEVIVAEDRGENLRIAGHERKHLLQSRGIHQGVHVAERDAEDGDGLEEETGRAIMQGAHVEEAGDGVGLGPPALLDEAAGAPDLLQGKQIRQGKGDAERDEGVQGVIKHQRPRSVRKDVKKQEDSHGRERDRHLPPRLVDDEGHGKEERHVEREGPDMAGKQRAAERVPQHEQGKKQVADQQGMAEAFAVGSEIQAGDCEYKKQQSVEQRCRITMEDKQVQEQLDAGHHDGQEQPDPHRVQVVPDHKILVAVIFGGGKGFFPSSSHTTPPLKRNHAVLGKPACACPLLGILIVQNRRWS